MINDGYFSLSNSLPIEHHTESCEGFKKRVGRNFWESRFGDDAAHCQIRRNGAQQSYEGNSFFSTAIDSL